MTDAKGKQEGLFDMHAIRTRFTLISVARRSWMLCITITLVVAVLSSVGRAQLIELAPPPSLQSNPQTAAEQVLQSNSRPEEEQNSTPELQDSAQNRMEAGETDSNAPADPSEQLSLADVIASVLSSFPNIQAARLRTGETAGNQIAAFGEFDTKIEGYTLSEPTGFYRNFRNGLGVSRRTWWGGYLAAGYRIGRGDFQPWYKERETNEGGEFKVAMGIPLLRGRAIDPQRVAVFQAELGRQAVQPEIQLAILEASVVASSVYWEWVASGARLAVQEELLRLATERQQAFETGEKADFYAEVDVVFNRTLVAERTAKVIETRQKYMESGFKLSFFLRGEDGNPMVPAQDWLPGKFPAIFDFPVLNLQQELSLALSRRPELALLQIDIQSLRLDRRLFCNQLLPQVDFYAEGSQDVGIPASSSNDKGQFQILTGLQVSQAVQRRKPRGKIQATDFKILQTNQKVRAQRDKIGIEIQSAWNRVRLAGDRLQQNINATEAAFDTLRRYRIGFFRGYTDLIYLNFLETKAFESQIKLVDAQSDWFQSLAALQAALGLDPLGEAMQLTSLPPAEVPSLQRMPRGINEVPEGYDEDWELHLKNLRQEFRSRTEDPGSEAEAASENPQ